MSFKAYDILSAVIPGFLFLLVLLKFLSLRYDKDLSIAYTAVAFLLGYAVNSIGSWLEGIYFWSWGGKPSSNLLNGKGIWKVKFYHSADAKALLRGETTNPNASSDELFSLAMRSVHGNKDTRVDDFNAMYAFARSLLTTALLGTIILISQHYDDWRYYAILLPISFVAWLRCKQRGYYYAREVLNEYLKERKAQKRP